MGIPVSNAPTFISVLYVWDSYAWQNWSRVGTTVLATDVHYKVVNEDMWLKISRNDVLSRDPFFHWLKQSVHSDWKVLLNSYFLCLKECILILNVLYSLFWHLRRSNAVIMFAQGLSTMAVPFPIYVSPYLDICTWLLLFLIECEKRRIDPIFLFAEGDDEAAVAIKYIDTVSHEMLWINQNGEKYVILLSGISILAAAVPSFR